MSTSTTSSSTTDGLHHDTQQEKKPSLLFLSLALLFAMIMCGSAGVVFTILTTTYAVSPALCASWRLAWVEVLQVIPFCLTLRHMIREDVVTSVVYEWGESGTALREQHEPAADHQSPAIPNNTIATLSATANNVLLVPRLKQSLPILAVSGICLGIHFSAWVYSLRTTTLTHSLLWVSMGPLLLHSYQWIVWLIAMGSFDPQNSNTVSAKAPTKFETIGCVLGLVGSIVLLGDVRRNNGNAVSGQPVPTFQGDFAALIGAAAVSIYLVLGQQLREWMPLWIYAFAVKGFAYLTCLALAIVFGPTPISFWPSNSLTSSSSILGCFVPPFVLYALYLGAGPGVAGHTLLNYLLKYMSPLTISTAMLSEPILGSYMGYLAHLQSLPGIYTWTGGTIVLVGLFLILYGENVSHVAQDAGQAVKQREVSSTKDAGVHGNQGEITRLLERS